MPSYKVATRFLGSCSSESLFNDLDSAIDFVKHEIQTMECFYRTVANLKDFKLTDSWNHGSHGQIIVQVMMPQYLQFKTKVNLLVIFRIEPLEEPPAMFATEQPTESALDRLPLEV